MTFETAVTRLEAITAKIEDPATPIEEAVALYKEAAKLIRFCTKTIDEAELQVKTVLGGEAVDDATAQPED